MEHIPVLLKEAIDILRLKSDGVYVDCTAGGGSHSAAILSQIPKGHLYAFDQDSLAIEKTEERLKSIASNYTLIRSNFVNIKEELAKYNINKVDGILFDLGVSSFQFDIPERGFSYRFDARLDMRMDLREGLTAYDIINNYDERELAKIFFRYGEESFARPIARKIVACRAIKKIETTFELVDIIKKALPQVILNKPKHPAKQVFQALRIAVNGELEILEKAFADSIELLALDGRIAVITFHSLEDRIAKDTFKKYSEHNLPHKLPIIIKELPPLKILTRKPIIPSSDELSINTRAHSAKLRCALKQSC